MAGRFWGGGFIKRIFIDFFWRFWYFFVFRVWFFRVWLLYVGYSIFRYWGGNNVIYIFIIYSSSRKKIKMDCLEVCIYLVIDI